MNDKRRPAQGAALTGGDGGERTTYQLFAPLRSEEYEALKADIAKRGVLVPAELDESGRVLDGHHRIQIAGELGIECPTVTRRFASETEKLEHVLKLNLLRRHLGPIAWAEAFRRLAETRGVELNGSHNRHTPRAATVAALAEELGVEPRTARHRIHVAGLLAEHPDLAAKVDAHEMELKRAHRVANERAAAARRAELPVLQPTADANIRIECCDFRSLAVSDADAIITDPPYIREFADAGLWRELGRFAARALKPGGLLVAYSGHTTFPEAFDQLRESLSYVWDGDFILPPLRLSARFGVVGLP
jgi:hypothetical protein